MPKITVITINYNNLSGLRATVDSVAAQTDRDFEYIVVDGASTDGSLDLIKEYSGYISDWISEPDKGVYNAMNKGASMASGEYCMFVNSGDCLFEPTTIAKLNALPNTTDIIFGCVANTIQGSNYYLWQPPMEEQLSLSHLRKFTLHHPGALIRTSLQRQIPYNEQLRICSDRQFFIEALILNDASYSTTDVITNRFAPAGLSSAAHDARMIEEDNKILNTLFSERMLRDITATNHRIVRTTRRMVKYYKFTDRLCAFNDIVLNIADKILSYKH